MKRSRIIVRACTWVVLLWPIVQIALVFAAQTNPWRLMGFGMYSTEHDIKVTLTKRGATGPSAIVQPNDLPPPARKAYDDFVERRAVLGRLCSPESFVRTWRQADPKLEPLHVDVDVEVVRISHARMTTVSREHFSQ